jgi:hypothetical protein
MKACQNVVSAAALKDFMFTRRWFVVNKQKPIENIEHRSTELTTGFEMAAHKNMGIPADHLLDVRHNDPRLHRAGKS